MTSKILIHVLKDHVKPDKISNKIGSHTKPSGWDRRSYKAAISNILYS